MIDYRVPLADMLFILDHVAEARRLPDWDGETVAEVLSHGARFVDEVIAPIDPIGDREGCQLVDGRVRLPKAFHQAFAGFRDGGWQGLVTAERYGGQGLPGLVGAAFSEMIAGACHSFHMAVSLVQGAMRTLEVNATDAVKDKWIPRLASAEWLATMCLTEPQAGSDLSLVRATATPKGDGWSIDGGKIFISGGDQDFTGKVLHLILARTRDAPPGVKGISLFLAPSEFDDGRPNGVSVVRIEEKMGLHAAATCQVAFDGTQAEMIGAPGEGLKRMFTLMNFQRLDVALQGVALATAATQRTLAYAQSRRQGRRPGATETSPIVDHDDVRRMLMTQLVLTLGGRAMCYRALTDVELNGNTPLADLMTSVCKVFGSEAAVEAAHLGIQVHGGYGFLREYRVEQVLRDSRITQIYEGTNGIHAMTLVGRLLASGPTVAAFEAEIDDAIAVAKNSGSTATAGALGAALENWKRTAAVLVKAPSPGAVAERFMRLTALVAFGAAWARLERAAEHAPNAERIRAGARFVREFMLPETAHLAALCQALPRLDDVPAAVFDAG